MLRESGILRNRRRREDLDPASGAANLADIMLVFVVGLMLSVIIHYGVDFESLTEDPEESAFKVGGYIYTDPETGVQYIIMD